MKHYPSAYIFWCAVLFLSIGTALLTSCNNTRYLAGDESLVHRNRYEISDSLSFRKKNKLRESLRELPYQIPNKRFLGMTRTRLWLYQRANQKKENKFWWWVKNKVGEKPVLLNRDLTKRSAQNMQEFLFNKGYLYAQVEPLIKTEEKLSVVTYDIAPGRRWVIDSIIWPSGNTSAQASAIKSIDETLLRTGEPLDLNVLDEERQRMSTWLRNDGFFYFNKDFIRFEIDTFTAEQTGLATLRCKVLPLEDGRPHERYAIRDVRVLITDRFDGSIDTTDYERETFKEISLFTKGKRFKPMVLDRGVYVEEGQYYSEQDVRKTQAKYANYGAFKFTNTQFVPTDSIQGKPNLDFYLIATRNKRQAISFDIEADHSIEGWTGSSIGVSYINRNLTGGSDQLRFRAGTGVEFQFLNARQNDVSVLNSADISLELNYALNRFLVPFRLKNVSKNSKVKTIFSLRYNFERRLDFYSLHSTNFSFGYDWFESSNKRHILNPINVNFFLLPEERKTALFQDRLDSIPSLARSFEERLIAGASYIFQMHNRSSIDDPSFINFTGDIATSGQFIHGLFSLVNRPRGKKPPYKLFGREYSQFIRLEGDVRYYRALTSKLDWVSRWNAGLAIGFGNSNVIPFFQQFYSGGPNSIRAFQLRQLGPGSFSDGVLDANQFFFDQAGDIKLEMSTELRFEVYKFIRAAIFLDAGNVWLLRDDPDRPNGAFSTRFYRDLALGTGAGARLDFDYFVIRFDMGIPLRDPRLTNPGKWTFSKQATAYNRWQDYLNLNLAIGYPF